MALVDYGESDSDVSGDEEAEDTAPAEVIVPVPPRGRLGSFLPKPKTSALADIMDEDEVIPRTPSDDREERKTPSQKTSLFAFLPKPSKGGELSPIEATDEIIEDFVKKKEKPAEAPSLIPGVQRTASGKVKISIPSLKDFADDEDDEDAPPPPKFKRSDKGSGLFAVLPPPKTASSDKAKPSLVPASVFRPKPPPVRPKVLPTKKPPVVPDDLVDSDDEGDEGGSDFFGFNAKDPVPIVPIVPTEILAPPPPKVVEIEPVLEAEAVTDLPGGSAIQPQGSSDLLEDEDALLKLQGKRGRIRESLEIIDVHAESHLPDAQDWLTKQLTQEQKPMSSAKKAGPMPGRQKHQITYLAQQAKERELELKNQWSQNRFTRRQTQSKYGF